jgi:hypothetical protein
MGDTEMNEIEKNNQIVAQAATQSLIQDLRQIIEQARGHVAATANYALSMMYWHIGERINREVLDNQRAEYGKQIVSQVATQLQEEYGKKGFETRSIRRMMQLAQEFPDEQIDVTTGQVRCHFWLAEKFLDLFTTSFHPTTICRKSGSH